MALTQISTQGIKDGTITGSDLATNVDLVDNQKLRLGTGNDLQIFHDGANSTIKNNSYALFLEGGSTPNMSIYLRPTAGENGIIVTGNGAAELYFDNSKKFETTSTGATVTGVLISDGLTLLDNEKILFGNNNDLEIFHNGTNNIIQSDVGDLQINSGNSAGDVVINTNNNVNNDTRVTSAKFIKNGSVELYHNNSKKFETTSSGATVTGNLFATNKFRGNDDVKLELGTGNDLQIYHNGTHSVISNNTGTLFTLADYLVFKNNANNETLMNATANGAVELYYDNSKKFETTSAGVSVTGTITSTGTASVADGHVQCQLDSGNGRLQLFNGSDAITVDIQGSAGNVRIVDNGKFQAGNSNDLQIYHNGTHSYIDNSTGVLFIRNTTATKAIYSRSDELLLQSYTGNENYLVATLNGGVDLYYDNSKKFETTSTGVAVTGGLTTTGDVVFNDTNTLKFLSSSGVLRFGDGKVADFGNSGDFRIFHDGSDAFLQNATGDLFIRATSTETGIKVIPNGAVELYHNNSKKFETTNIGIKITSALGIANVGGTLAGSGGTENWIGIKDSADNFQFIVKTAGTNNGSVGIGTTSPDHLLHCETSSAVAKFDHTGTGDTTGIVMRHARGGLSGFSGKIISFLGNQNTEKGSIVIGTNAVAYNTSSDYRLKENEVAISDGITRLKQLKPYIFNFKEDPDVKVDGFFAHEVSSVVPEAITGTKDAVATQDSKQFKKGDPIYQSIDQSKLVPLLTAAIQEAIAKIETLETEVAALKAG